MNKELIEKICSKKEFSQLPKKDVELAFEKFDKKDLNDFQKLKMTRQFLRKLYSSFSSRKLLGEINKEKEVEWFLGKHKSTKERLEFYSEVYSRVFKDLKDVSVIDLGAGINGLTLDKMKGVKNYVAVEGVGQLVDLVNDYFKKNKMKNAKAEHFSLFELEKVKEIIKEQKMPRVVFMFKVIDALEVVERDYSKKLLGEIVPLSDRVVLSFPTRSLGNRKKFSVQRGWLLNFIQDNFSVIDDFELGGEKYIVFEKRK